MSCFITHHASPLACLLLAADEEGLTGLWLEGQKYFAAGLPQQREEQRTPALGRGLPLAGYLLYRPGAGFYSAAASCGLGFQRAAWSFCCRSPTGQTTTYGALAGELARQRGLTHFSRRRWAAPWGITVFPLLSPATG